MKLLCKLLVVGLGVLVAFGIPAVVFLAALGVTTCIMYGLSYLVTMAFDVYQLSWLQSFVIALVYTVLFGVKVKD